MKGERAKVKVSKWTIAFLLGAIVIGAYFWNLYRDALEKANRSISFYQDIPETPKLDGLSGALAEALSETYSRLSEVTDKREPLGVLGKLYHANGFNQRARECYEILLLLEPEDVQWPLLLAHLASDYSDPSLELGLRMEAKVLGASTAVSNIALARSFSKAGRLNEALETLDLILNETPHEVDALMEKGDLLLRIERFEEAVIPLEVALKLKPDSWRVHDLLISALGGLGDGRRHPLKYQRLSMRELARPQLDPVADSVLSFCLDPVRLATLADRKNKEGETVLAVKLLEQAKSIDPGFEEAYFGLGEMYRIIGDENKSIEAFKKGMALGGADVRMYLGLAQSYLEYGSVDEGLETIETGLKKFPMIGGLFRVSGELYEKKGQYKAAVVAYKKAIERDGADLIALKKLGALELRARNKEGLGYLKKRLLYVPEDVDAAILIAGFLVETGEDSEAKVILENARRYDPESVEIRSILKRIEDRSL